MASRKISPRASWLPAQIQNPVLQGQFLLTLLLISGRQIEMRVDMLGVELSSSAQMLHSFVNAAHFIQNTAQIEMRGHVVRIELQRGAKSSMRILHFAALIIDAACVDMRLAPSRLHLGDLPVNEDRFLGSARPRLATNRIFEQLIRSTRLHLANFRLRCMKGKDELPGERL